MSEAFRMVRQFGQPVHEPNVYRVETVRLMTEAEALQLMRDLGSPYKGQRYPNTPTLTDGATTAARAQTPERRGPPSTTSPPDRDATGTRGEPGRAGSA